MPQSVVWAKAGEPKCRHSTARRQGYDKNKVFILKARERESRPEEAWAGNWETGAGA